ncbi:MAG: PIN domain-containing protein [Deltaproteobacteria bacterium]|nr:MAG: PIN domain-containing protein [Deltaproteobacteria bacterium]
MSGRSFVDTNVLVYCFDAGEPAKRKRALEIMDGKADVGDLVLSTQVLQEFYVTVTRKLKRPLPGPDAAAAVRELAKLSVIQIDLAMVLSAIEDCQSYQLSLWDTLILRSALTASCERLLTEDLQHGFQFESVRVENPFL